AARSAGATPLFSFLGVIEQTAAGVCVVWVGDGEGERLVVDGVVLGIQEGLVGVACGVLPCSSMMVDEQRWWGMMMTGWAGD
ncbi:hypothetical protein Dimus_007620, partial [Dionaea muscipula]